MARNWDVFLSSLVLLAKRGNSLADRLVKEAMRGGEASELIESIYDGGTQENVLALALLANLGVQAN